MNRNLTYLAISNRKSFVAVTKGGTIFINWEGETIELHQGRFKRLARLLKQSAHCMDSEELSDGGLCLTRGDGGDYHLTVGAFGIHVASNHFDSLVRMVLEASHWTNTVNDGLSAQPA